jgi:V8-like Glu-specific endopeptidase
MNATTPVAGPVTGLHTPITNILPTESTVAAPVISPGSVGMGDMIETPPEAVSEALAEAEMEFGLEAAIDFSAPDLSTLSDVGVASFGEPPMFEAVIGTDERRRITNTRQYPWRLAASLLITAGDNSQWIGTAWFTSPRTLVTAGHCVYIKHSGVPGRDGWVKKIQVMPGRNGSEVPFGGMSATEFWTVTGWGEKGMENYDYGAIILPSAFPQDLGHFAYGVFEDEKLLTSTVNIFGYPSDKEKGTLWYDFRQVGSVNPDKVYYAADTAGGQSGACVYIFHEGQRTGVAIHAYGGVTANSGTRISSQVFANLEAWKRT